MSSQTHVYQSIARATKDHGTTKMFGLMGDANVTEVLFLQLTKEARF